MSTEVPARRRMSHVKTWGCAANVGCVPPITLGNPTPLCFKMTKQKEAHILFRAHEQVFMVGKLL